MRIALLCRSRAAGWCCALSSSGVRALSTRQCLQLPQLPARGCGQRGAGPATGAGLVPGPAHLPPGPAPRRRGGRCRQGAVRGRGALAPFGGAVSSRRAQALNWPRGFCAQGVVSTHQRGEPGVKVRSWSRQTCRRWHNRAVAAY